ncbi:MAG: hypothetical protein U0354_17200 [Candidatus Sericytochromatia bacterium]
MCGRITSNQHSVRLSDMKELKDPKIAEKIKNAKIDDSIKPTVCPTTSLDPDDGFKGGCMPPHSKIKPEPIDLGDIIGKINKFNPKQMVEKIRSGDVDAKLDFKGMLDGLSKKDLQVLRDYLVNEMANPENKDDELLGNLLNRVNDELDTRPVGGRIRPFPEPIICGPFPWERPDPNVLFKRTENMKHSYDMGLGDQSKNIKIDEKNR